MATLIPEWFPGNPIFWTLAAGVALLLGGIGLLVPRTAVAAAQLSGLMILSWVFIVHLAREIAGVGDGIAVFEATAIVGLLLVLAGDRMPPRGWGRIVTSSGGSSSDRQSRRRGR